MVEPLSLTAKLVKSIVESLNGVRSNYDECERLGHLGKRTLVMVSQIGPKSMTDQSLSEALINVNEGLNGAQAAIDDCCNTSCLCALLLYKTHSSALRQAAKDLDRALIQIPLAALAITLDMKNNLATLVDSKSHEAFSGEGSSAHKMTVTKTEFDEVSVRMDQGFDDIKKQIENLTHNLGLNLDSSGTLTPTINLVTDISLNVKKVKTNKERCSLLAKWVEQTLEALRELEGKELYALSILELLRRVNEALCEVKQSIDSCCSTNVFHGVIFYERYSSRLNKAATALENALCMIPWALDEVPFGVQSALSTICNEIHNASFQRRANENVQSVDVDLLQSNNTEASQIIEDIYGKFPLHLAASNNSVDTLKVKSS